MIRGVACLRQGTGVVRPKLAIAEEGTVESREFTMSFHTIKDGEQVLIFNRGGSGRVVVGPRRVRERVCGKRMLLGRVVSRSQKL